MIAEKSGLARPASQAYGAHVEKFLIESGIVHGAEDIWRERLLQVRSTG